MASNFASPCVSLEKVLECKLCKNELTEPHALQECLHSYCKKCLDTIPRKEKDGEQGRFCPLCNNFTKEGDIRYNEFMEDLLNISKTPDSNESNEKQTCQHCFNKDKELTARCSDCKIPLCKDCQTGHVKIPILKDHKIITLDDEDTEKFIDKIIFCTVHQNKVVEYNCKDCEVLACSACNLSEHNNHTTETVDQALERLMPEMETNRSSITTCVSQMEAQLKTVFAKIDSTKEVFAACRLELDERLEKLVNKLKAMKAQMEDDITEQETIALDILENIKQSLEYNLSEAKNITAIADITKEKVKHTSLLHQMQNCLQEKLRQCVEKKPELIDIQLQSPEFSDDQDLNGSKEKLQQLIGEVQYNARSWNICTAGQLWTENEFICDDLTYLIEKEYKMSTTEVDIQANWCNRLSYIDNKLWLCFEALGEIRMFSKSGIHLKTMHNDKCISVVRMANNGDIIAAGDEGLYITNMDCSTWTKLVDGEFSDICVHGQKLSALEYETHEIVTYEYQVNESCNGSSGTKWAHVSSIKNANTSEEFIYNANSTLLADSDSNFLVCFLNSFALQKLCQGGEILNSFKVSWGPNLCGIDKNGKLLISRYNTGALHVVNNLDNFDMTVKLQGTKLRDAIIDNDYNIWTLEGDLEEYKLVKYVAVDADY